MAVTAETGQPMVTMIRPSSGWFDLDLGAVWRYRELLFYLVWREMKVRYKQAALGVAWAIVQPLFTVLIFTIIFGIFARFPSDGLPYPVFALAAVLPWTYFAEALRRGATGLVADAELVRKVYFPRLIIPLAGVTSPLVDFLFGLLILIGVMFWYGIVPGWTILLLPFWLFITLALALSIGLWLGPINVRYRDMMHTLPFVIAGVDVRVADRLSAQHDPAEVAGALQHQSDGRHHRRIPLVAARHGHAEPAVDRHQPVDHCLRPDRRRHLLPESGAVLRGRHMSSGIAIQARGLGKRYLLRCGRCPPQLAARRPGVGREIADRRATRKPPSRNSGRSRTPTSTSATARTSASSG